MAQCGLVHPWSRVSSFTYIDSRLVPEGREGISIPQRESGTGESLGETRDKWFWGFAFSIEVERKRSVGDKVMDPGDDVGGEAGSSHNFPAPVVAPCVKGVIDVVSQYCWAD